MDGACAQWLHLVEDSATALLLVSSTHRCSGQRCTATFLFRFQYDLALELRSYARHRLTCKPHFVLFDSWYPSQKLLKCIRDYGWYFVCQLKKNRRFEGRPLVRYLQQPY